MQERGGLFPGFKVGVEDTRSYPQGAFGSEFLGLLGEISQHELKARRVQAREGGRGRRPERRRGGVRLAPQRGLRPAKIPRRLARPHRRRRSAVAAPASSSPTLQLSIDARLQRAAQKALLDGMRSSRLNGHSPDRRRPRS